MKKSILKTEAYFVYVDKYIGVLIPLRDRKPLVSYAPREKFIELVQRIHKKHPTLKMRCVLDEGIESYIRKAIKVKEFIKSALTNKSKSL